MKSYALGIIGLALAAWAGCGPGAQKSFSPPLSGASFARPARFGETVLHSFGGKGQGNTPVAGLRAAPGGRFFGATSAGGPFRGGTVYELVPRGGGYAMHILHAFGHGNDGEAVYASPLLGPNGVLYGTTFFGGAYLQGTVYELVPSARGYTEKILVDFTPVAGPANPAAGFIRDASGALYGTTLDGGSVTCSAGGCGTVYKLTPSASGFTESVLYNFLGGSDGANPAAPLLELRNGVFVGTTQGGGPMNGGTAFELTAKGHGFTERVIHSFGRSGDGNVVSSGLVADAAGALYGTTDFGGAHNDGILYKLTPSGNGYTESVLYSFKADEDGVVPYGTPIVVGNLIYGTTSAGGKGCPRKGRFSGCGTIFAVNSAGTERVLYRFANSPDGSDPVSSVIDRHNQLFGTTYLGGTDTHCTGGCGTIFRLQL